MFGLGGSKRSEEMANLVESKGGRIITENIDQQLSSAFYTEFGPIGFKGVKEIYDFGNGIKYFKGSYYLNTPRQGRYQTVLAFLFQTKAFEGYHKVFPKKGGSFYTSTMSLFGGKNPAVNVGIPEIDDNYTVISNNQDSVRQICWKLVSPLTQIIKLVPFSFFQPVDVIPVSFVMHVSNGKALVLFSTSAEKKLTEFYPLVEDIMKKLSE